jgi:hypothetical protein
MNEKRQARNRKIAYVLMAAAGYAIAIGIVHLITWALR